MKTSVGTNVALIAVFAALIAAFALMPPLFMVGLVPFAVQIIVVLLAPLAIGPWQGFLANLLYVVVGIAGLPVFAGQRAGIAVVLGPTGGYLVGYMVSAIAVGYVASLVLRRRSAGVATIVGLTVASWVGVLVIHACGVVGLMLAGNKGQGMAFPNALAVTTPFVPLDLVKGLIAALIAAAIFKAFPRLLAMRR